MGTNTHASLSPNTIHREVVIATWMIMGNAFGDFHDSREYVGQIKGVFDMVYVTIPALIRVPPVFSFYYAFEGDRRAENPTVLSKAYPDAIAVFKRLCGIFGGQLWYHDNDNRRHPDYTTTSDVTERSYVDRKDFYARIKPLKREEVDAVRRFATYTRDPS